MVREERLRKHLPVRAEPSRVRRSEREVQNGLIACWSPCVEQEPGAVCQEGKESVARRVCDAVSEALMTQIEVPADDCEWCGEVVAPQRRKEGGNIVWVGSRRPVQRYERENIA